MGDMGNTPARDHTDAAGDCGHPVLGTADGTQAATSADQYATRHDPFVYFHSIIDDPAKCDAVVPLSRLPHDVASGPPAFSWITPNLCDDGHDAVCAGTNVDGTHAGGFTAIDAFLSRYVPIVIGSAAFRSGGVLVVTFDEAGTSDASACCGETPGPGSPLPGIVGPGGGHVATIVVSPFSAPGTRDGVSYNQYSMLRTIEDLFGLSHLGEAANTTSYGRDVFDAAPTAAPSGATGPAASPGGGTGPAQALPGAGSQPGSGSLGGAGSPGGSLGGSLPRTGRRTSTGPAAVMLAGALVLLVALNRARARARPRAGPSRTGGPPGRGS